MMRIGIDLGGTKTSGIVIAPDGSVVLRERIPSHATDYQKTLQMLQNIVTKLGKVAGPDAPVGIGMPGSHSPTTGLVRNSNSRALNGQSFDADLRSLITRPIRFANDADCFALAEAFTLPNPFDKTVFGVIIGTGTGAGIVINGRLLSGPNSVAGEWGHNPLPWMDAEKDPAHPCYCGKNGCIETFLSGPGLARHHFRTHGEDIAPEIIARRDTSERRKTMDIYADRLARGLAHIINILDPTDIILGGGVSEVDFLYERVPELLPAYVFSDHVSTRLSRHSLGNDSGVFGAAQLWPAEAS